MKNLVKLNGVKALSKNEQKSINGGVRSGACWCDQDWYNAQCGYTCIMREIV